MNQLPLLAIRQQPAPRPLVEWTTRKIRAYVRERVQGYPARQAERERRRRKEREQGRQKSMAEIRATYRAIFEQPAGELNPMGARLPGLIPVELFYGKHAWRLRSLLNGQEFMRCRQTFTTAAHGREQVERWFEHKRQDWQAWGKMPDHFEPEQLNDYDTLCSGDGLYRVVTPADRYHVMPPDHQPLSKSFKGSWRAACNREVKASRFIDFRANVEPSCRECAEVWRKEYQGK